MSPKKVAPKKEGAGGGPVPRRRRSGAIAWFAWRSWASFPFPSAQDKPNPGKATHENKPPPPSGSHFSYWIIIMNSSHSSSGKKVVVITGSSSGIGAEAARYFAGQGWRVAATMRHPEKYPRVFEDKLITTFKLDVTEPDNIGPAIDKIISEFGKIDVLVNNAGYGVLGPLESLSDEQIRLQFETNLFGLIRVTQAVLPHMRLARSGTIINISSVGGRMAFPLFSVYHSTKFAVEGLTESIRYELKPFGIRVKLVEPGGIKTDFGTRSITKVNSAPYQRMIDKTLGLLEKASGRLPGPQAVAKTIFRAATDQGYRLRYPVHHQPYFLLNSLLPDLLWRRFLESVFTAS